MKSVPPAVAGGYCYEGDMTPITPNQTRIEAMHRILLIIWAFLAMSVSGLFLMAVLVPASAPGDNSVLAIVLLLLGTSSVILSFVIKQSFLAKSVAKQDLKLVQQAYIVALALCESAGLFGLLIHFATGLIYYYAAFGIGMIGMLLHFPKKQHLLDASYKQL
jgi:hypothetical protein